MLNSIFFPKPMRNFPGQRWIRISVRTWHLLAMGWLLGGTATGLTMAEQSPALWMTFLSGVVFSFLELYQTFIWLFQLKGQAVILKLFLLGVAASSGANGLSYLIAAVIIGGISSHMPGKYRYYSLYHRRVIKE